MHRPRFLARALVALWLGGLHRLGGRGAKRLRARDIPALLERDDTLIVDTETTGIGRRAEVIEVVAIDTTGALQLDALSIPVGPISHESWEIHGFSLHTLHAQGARPTAPRSEDYSPRWTSGFEIASTASRAPTAEGGYRLLSRVCRHRNTPVRWSVWQVNWRNVPA